MRYAGFVALAALWTVLTPPPATGSPREAQEQALEGGAAADRGVDTVGVFPLKPGLYTSRQAFSTVIATPPLGRHQTGVTVSVNLHEVAVVGGELRASTQFCSIQPIPFGGVKSTMPDEFVAAMPIPVVPVTVEGPEGGPWSVDFGEWTVVIGAELENPTTDALPTDGKDSRVTDPDGDGKPGVTVLLTGLIRGRDYVVQRIVRSMHGTLAPDGSMSGTIDGRAEQETLGASNPLLAKFKATFLDETEPRLNVFTWLPVPPGTTCEDLIAQQDALFD